MAGASGGRSLQARELKSGLSSKILGKRIVGALFVPEDADDPPAFAVVEELKAVDSAREGRIASVVAGLVAAEDLRHVAEDFDAAVDGRFEKTVLEEVSAAAVDVIIHGVGMDADGAVGCFARGGKMRDGEEKRTEAIPVALAGRAGDHGIKSNEDVLNGVNVFGLRGGNASKGIGARLLRRPGRALLLGGRGARRRLRGGRLGNGESSGKNRGHSKKCKLHN